ncbi:formin-like family protein [Cryptosporidium muris RN66]|uniref:Formin-like family protein n=1 Tax=Cryptosporidium muris (strain RN66) TaxID=441375 RepID=B6AB85_CRYMR|nr:formin-like family protein [Cryptosporidium muris RN66]EEA05637.1 formin-like family protein [Cryptosporidium muris RN66]|eukprot:XP_002139986.1 formin-like family protein [Cryptosporidium muris RN66]
MISTFVNRILGNIPDNSDTKDDEEHPAYCLSSLITFYKPNRLKSAIFDHIPGYLNSLSIDLYTVSKSGNFKEYILSNIHNKKRLANYQTLVKNGESFYSIISATTQDKCKVCGYLNCSSLVVDFSRNADNGETTYLIFQGELILRIYDRSLDISLYCLVKSISDEDILRVTNEDVILILPEPIELSYNFTINFILYSSIGRTWYIGDNNFNLTDKNISNDKNINTFYESQVTEENLGDKLDNINKSEKNITKQFKFSISCIQNVSICNKEIEDTTDKGSSIILNSSLNMNNENSDIDISPDTFDTRTPKPNKPVSNGHTTPLSNKSTTASTTSVIRGKAPPLPAHMKSGSKSKVILKKSIKIPSLNRKNLPLGRRIHWNPLSDEAAQKSIFREILYAPLNSQSPPVSPQISPSSSPTFNTPLSVTSLSPMSTSPALSDFHIANTLVNLETLSRVFTKPSMSTSTSPIPSFLPNSSSVEDISGIINDEVNMSLKQELPLHSTDSNYSSKNSNILIPAPIKQIPLQSLSQKRAQNIAIVLARLLVPIDYIIEVLQSFKISNLTLDDYERIEQVLPTTLEIERLKNNKKELHPLEQFLLRFSHISNPMARLRFLKFEHILDASEFDIQRNLNTLFLASQQMRNSNKLKFILKAVLLWGNYVNHGISFETLTSTSSFAHAANTGSINWSLLETKGFSLVSLLRLAEFKTVIDPSLTSLHFLVANLTIAAPQLNLHLLVNDMPAVSQASKISVDMLYNNISDMKKELAILETEKSYFANDRVDYLFDSYSRRLDALVEGYNRIVEKVADTAIYFGQNISSTDKNLSIQPLFETLNTFIVQFTSCCKEVKEKPQKFASLLVDPTMVFPNNNNISVSNCPFNGTDINSKSLISSNSNGNENIPKKSRNQACKWSACRHPTLIRNRSSSFRSEKSQCEDNSGNNNSENKNNMGKLGLESSLNHPCNKFNVIAKSEDNIRISQKVKSSYLSKSVDLSDISYNPKKSQDRHLKIIHTERNKSKANLPLRHPPPKLPTLVTPGFRES